MKSLVAAASLVLCVPAASAGSLLDAASSRSYSRSEAELAAHVPLEADLVTRPDELLLTVDVRVENPDPARAIYTASIAAAEVHKRFIATGLKGDLEPHTSAFGPGESRSKSSGDAEPILASVGFTLRLPLPEGDFWSRAQISAKAKRLADELTRDTEGAKDGYRLRFAAPLPHVRNAEKFREELLKRLGARVREVAALVGDKAHPLVPSECSIPGHVVQSSTSLEESALSLQLSCILVAVR